MQSRGQKHFILDSYDDVFVDEDMDVSKANIVFSKVSKLSTEARTFSGQYSSEMLILFFSGNDDSQYMWTNISLIMCHQGRALILILTFYVNYRNKQGLSWAKLKFEV